MSGACPPGSPRAHLAGLTVLVLLCLVWPGLLYLRGMLDDYVAGQVVGRVLSGGDGGHKNPVWYYLGALPVASAPWVLAAPAVARWLARGPLPDGWDRAALRFAAWVLPLGALLLSVPSTKRELYLLPLLPMAAVAAGAWLSAVAGGVAAGSWDRRACAAVFGVFGALPVLFLGTVSALKAGLAWGTHPDLGVIAEAVTWPALAVLACFGAAFAAWAILGFRVSLREPRRAAPWLPWLAFLACLTVVHGYAYRLGDPVKNLHGFTRDLAADGVLDSGLVGFRLDETTRAMIPFDTGRRVRNVEDPAEVERHFEASPDGRLLALERQVRVLPEALRSRLRRVRHWSYLGGREYGLYALER